MFALWLFRAAGTMEKRHKTGLSMNCMILKCVNMYGLVYHSSFGNLPVIRMILIEVCNFIFNPFFSRCTRHSAFSHQRNHSTMLGGRMSWQLRWLFIVLFLTLIAQSTSAQKESTGSSVDVGRMSLLEIEDALQVYMHPSVNVF